MREVLLYLLQNLLVLDFLVLAVWVLDQCVHWNMGHLWRKWLWFLICLRMLFPIEIHLQDLHPSWEGLQMELTIPVKESQAEAPKTADSQEESLELVNGMKENWELVLLGLWFFGVVVSLFYHSFQYYFVKDFFFEEAGPCRNPHMLTLRKEWCRTYRMRQIPELLEKEGAITPMTFGYFRKKLVYPTDTYEEAEDALILRHELIHIKYGDSWYKALVLFVCDLYWFNPVFCLMKQMAFRDVEYVCDERVSRHMTEEEKQVYGSAILKAVKSSAKGPAPSMVQFAAGKKELGQRLQNLFAFKGWQKGLIPLFLGIFAAAVLLTGITVTVEEIPADAAEGKKAVLENVEEDVSSHRDISLRWENEEPIAATCYTDDWKALNSQRDVESSYITDRFTGFNHYYIDEAGTLWGTGTNDMWQLGIPEEHDIHNLDHVYTEPVKIAEKIIHVDASVNSAFAIYLTEEGNLYGIGANTYGVLRMPPLENEMLNPWLNLAPCPQLLMEEVVYASAGKTSLSVLTRDGKVWWWGLLQATTGTTGIGKVYAQEPRLMLENARYTVCGFDTAAAIDQDNHLWLWGCNVWGQCGTEGGDYLSEPYRAETEVEMVWPDFLSSRQNIFDAEAWQGMNPYNDGRTGCIYSYTTCIRKTDGAYYACGIDLGHNTKTVAYYGDLFLENATDPESYIRDYSWDFLRIDVKENPR